MKILFICLLAVFGFSQPLFSAQIAGQQQEEAKDDHNTWNFGKVKEGDLVKREFILKNDSSKKLIIQDVSTSCGCTASKIKDKELMPGDSTTIDVQFNSKGYSGEVKQFIYVHTDSIDKPIIRFIIKAQVERTS